MSYLNGYFGMIMIMGLFLFLQICPSLGLWFWFSGSSSSGNAENKQQCGENSRTISRDSVAEFSIEPFTNRRGMKKLDDARNKIAIAAPNSCWQRAYNSLFSGCSRTLSDEESRNRFAWHLTDCFLQHAGRNTLPYCDPKSPVAECLKVVDREAVNVYLEYHLETNSICHQLQETLKQLSEFGHKQQEELLKRQDQLLRAHDNLVESSKTILSAQEAFESKQARIFVALDKLFALHNAMLLESRVIKAVLFYTFFVFVIQMFTSVKQTQNVRPRVYMGLFLTFLIEYVILRWTTTNIDRCGWLISLNRSIFGLLSLIQIIYAVCTYRDYNRLNHQILLDMAEGMNALRKEKMLSSCDSDADSELDWSSWIDNELPEDVDKLEDPDYVYKEEVGENSIETSFLTKRYNLRSRS